MKFALLGIAAAVTLGAMPASAHHSAAMFDQQKLVVLKGAMRSVTFLNPHVWLSVVGSADAAAPVRWDVEATSTAQMARIGLTPAMLKEGDKVTVAIRPMRDGRKAGSLVFVVTADGKTYGAKPTDLGLDAATLTPR